MNNNNQNFFISVEALRERITSRLLPIMVFALWLMLFGMLMRDLPEGVEASVIAMCAITVLTTILWFIRKRLPSDVVALAMVALLSFAFLTRTLQYGLMSPAQLVPPMIALFLMLLGYRRASYASIAITVVFSAAAAWLFIRGVLPPPPDPAGYVVSPIAWSLWIIASGTISLVFVSAFRLLPQTLESSEERFRVAFDNANEGVCLTGVEGGFLEVNKAFCEMLGYTREQLLRMQFNDVTHPDDIQIGADFIRRALTGGDEKGSLEKRYLHRQGQIVWVQVSSSLVRDAAGKSLYFVSHVQDITAQKEALQKLKESEERFKEIFDSVNDAIVIHDAKTGAILEVNGRMCQMYGCSREEALQLNVTDLSLGTHPYDQAAALRWMRKAAAGRPQLFEWRSKSKSGRVFWSEVNMRRAMIGDEARLVVTVRDVEERKRAEAALKESETTYQTLFNSASDAIFLMRDGVFVDCNQMTQKMFGVSREQILGHRPAEYSPAMQPGGRDSAGAAEERIGAALSGSPQLFEWQHIRGDGKLFDAEVSLTRLELPEGAKDLLAIVRDITERKREIEALRTSEETFNKIFHASPAPMSMSRLRDGAYIDVNASFLRVMEYAREEIIGHTAIELNTWADAGEREEVTAILQKNGSVHNFEGGYRAKSGRIGRSLVSAEVIELQGEPYILGVSLDITERKEMEEALRQSQERFSKVFMAVPAGISLSTLDEGRLIEVNREFERLIGYTHDELIGRTSFDVGLWLDSKDRENFTAEILAKGMVSDLVLRIRSRNGKILLLRTNALTLELNGKALLLSSFADVTERQMAEEALRISEERYRALVENTPDIIARFDRNRHYLFVNSAVTKVSTLKPTEFIGRTLWDVDFTPEQARERDQLLRSVIDSGVGLETELEFDAPAGHRVFEWRAYPELGSGGQVESVIAINRDITERKRAEASLRASMEQLHALAQRMEKIREEERKAVSHEVHDELGQVLTALRMDLMAVKEIPPAQTIIFEEKVKSVLDLTDSAIAIVQDIAARLRPGMLDYLGLLAAIEWQTEEFQKRSGVKCTLALLDHEPVLDNERATALFRILQETLTNVARHAHARNVRITLEESGADIVMTIADDGVGISRSQIDSPQSLGLLGMRERLHPFRGICTIGSPQSGGTTVTVRLPGNLDRT